MCLSRSGRTDQDGAAVPWDEVAVEQTHDGGLGNAFGEVEVVVGQGLLLGEACLPQAPLQGTLLADGLFHADERGQHFQHGRCLCGRRRPALRDSIWRFPGASSRRDRGPVVWAKVSGRAMGILLGVVAKAVVKGGVGGFEFDVVDQFAAFGSGECRRGELPAAAFGQQQILHASGIVGRSIPRRG